MKRILLVDDDEFLRDSLGQILEKEGYDVDYAQDGLSAVDKFSDNKYHLVITDIYMPSMDGIKLISHLRDRNPRIRIICMSGVHRAFRSADLNLAKYLGANEIITKPFEKRMLLAKVGRQLAMT